jgi:hypothetical protein
MPWNERTEDAYDIAGARQILDEDHTGLDDVKERHEFARFKLQKPRKRCGAVGRAHTGKPMGVCTTGSKPSRRGSPITGPGRLGVESQDSRGVPRSRS